MLNKNLDLTIEKYISVDFAAMTDAVDLLGGIDIDVDETEIDHLNNYMVETSKVTGVASKPLTHTGLQTLDGVQATSYCRIRYTAGDDFKRTERQREVIQELVRKAKTMEISKINDIIMLCSQENCDQLFQTKSFWRWLQADDRLRYCRYSLVPFDRADR